MPTGPQFYSSLESNSTFLSFCRPDLVCCLSQIALNGNRIRLVQRNRSGDPLAKGSSRLLVAIATRQAFHVHGGKLQAQLTSAV